MQYKGVPPNSHLVLRGHGTTNGDASDDIYQSYLLGDDGDAGFKTVTCWLSNFVILQAKLPVCQKLSLVVVCNSVFFLFFLLLYP